jgi:hypothetical protein
MYKKLFSFGILFLLLISFASATQYFTCDLVSEGISGKGCEADDYRGIFIASADDLTKQQCDDLCESLSVTGVNCCAWRDSEPLNSCYYGIENVDSDDYSASTYATDCINYDAPITEPEITTFSASMITANSVRFTGTFLYNDFSNITAYFKLNNATITPTTNYFGSGTQTLVLDKAGLSSLTPYNYSFCIDAIKTNGLVSYYKFDENSGATTEDGVDSNDLSIVNSNWITGKINSALEYNGTNYYVYTTNLEDFDFVQNTGVFSFSFWLKLPSVSSDRVEHLLTTTAITTINKGFALFYDNRVSLGSKKMLVLNLLKGTSGTFGANYILYNAITDTNYHHIVVTGDGTTIKVYIDGVLKVPNTNTWSGLSTGNSNREFRIGSGANQFNGIMDELGIYNIAIPQTQITELYNSGNGIVGYSEYDTCEDSTFTTTNQLGTPFVYVPTSNSIDEMFDGLDTDDSWAELLGGFFIVLAVIFISAITFGTAKVEYGAFGFLIFGLIGVLISTIVGLFPAYILVLFLSLSLIAIIINKVWGN